jgi:hypothetical protein
VYFCTEFFGNKTPNRALFVLNALISTTIKNISQNTRLALAGAIGGPLVATLLLTKKIKHGNPWTSGILWLAGLGMACGLLFIPQELLLSFWVILLPLFFFFYTYTAIIYLHPKFDDNISFDNLSVIAFLGLLFSVGTFILSFYASPFPGYRNRIEFNNPRVRLHYHRSVKPDDAGKIAQMLHRTRFTDSPDSLDMFLSNTDSSFVLRFSVYDTLNFSNPLFVAEFKKIELILNNQTVLKKPIVVKFSSPYSRADYELNDVLLPIDGIHHEILSLLSNRISENQTILYNISVREEDLEVLKNSLIRLKKYFPADSRVDVIFELKHNRYNLKFFVNKANWEIESQKHRLRLVGEYLIQSGLSKPIRIFMVDSGGEKSEVY